jgi:hypothetical protein
MNGTTEASDVAHFATFWAAVAVMLGREIHMWSGTHVYPNEYIAFFGPSGDKKTTAQRRMTTCGLLDRDPSIQIIQSAGSTEGLAEMLIASSGRPHLFLWEEFASVLAIAKWSGSTLREFVVETYDCPSIWTREYRRQNRIEIECPTPTILTMTTPEWFWLHATPDDFFGGFSNRFVFLSGSKKDDIPDPADIDGTRIAAIKRSVSDRFDELMRSTRRRGHWTAEAQRLWRDFYGRSNQQRDGLLGAALKRTHAHVRKLALVYAFLEGSFPEITADQLSAAIGVNVYAMHCTKQLLDSRASTPASQERREMETRIMDLLRKHPAGMRLRKLQQRICHRAGDSESFQRVIRSLKETDQARITDDGRRMTICATD